MKNLQQSMRAALIGGIALFTAMAGVVTATPLPKDTAAHVVLPDGRRLDTGGEAEGHITAQAALVSDAGHYEPLPAKMLHPRSQHTSTVLPNGRVLIWGGVDGTGQVVKQGEWFDPTTGAFSEASEIALLPRAGHTATLLSDGRLLLLGGHADKLGKLAEAEVWDWRTNRSELLPVALTPPREGHSAQLLADGRLLIVGAEAKDTALYDPERVRFLPAQEAEAARAAEPAPGAARVTGSSPTPDQRDVALDAVLALRFDPPLAPASLNDKTVTLFGPRGATPVQVVAAEAGRLVFVTPRQELFPASRYTLFIQGAQTPDGRALSFHAQDFETQRIEPAKWDDRLEWNNAPAAQSAANGATSAAAASEPNSKSNGPTTSPGVVAAAQQAKPDAIHRFVFTRKQEADTDFWAPDAENLLGRWRSRQPMSKALRDAINLALSRNSQEAAWRKGELRSGATEVTGQVLSFSDRPLKGVDVSIGDVHVQTDGDGRFALRGIAAGHQQILIDGAGVGGSADSFGQFLVGAEVQEGRENPVKPVFLPEIRAQDWIEIPSPLTSELVVRTPYMPGFEVHLPAGTILRGRDGKVVRRIAVIPMPLDRTPINYPVNTPLHMTFQPGGMSVEGLKPGVTKGIRFVYPNYSDGAPGTRAGFLNYDPIEKGWYTYGYGKVSADGARVEPDPDTQIYSATGFGIWFGKEPPPKTPQQCGATGGDPVDLRTGLFKHSTQGPELSDVVPLSLHTSYRPDDDVKRDFGKGTNHSFGMYLYNTQGAGPHPAWDSWYLVLPDCALVRFDKAQGTDYTANYLATSTASSGSFFGAKLTYVYDNYRAQQVMRITRRDGTELGFSITGGHLVNLRDKWGRVMEVVLSGGVISRITSPSGRYVDIVNGSAGISSATDIGGHVWSYRYNASGYLDRVTYPDLTHDDFTYDPQSNRMTDVYDRRGNRMVHNVYDSAGRVQDQTLADGATYHFAYTTGANGVVTQTDVTQPNGSVRRVVFHASGHPASDTDAVGTSLQRTTTYERDAIGYVTATTDPLGRRTEIVYDADRHVTSVTQLAGTAQARTATFTWTPSHDLATATDPWNRTTTYTWDVRRRLQKVQDPFGRSVLLEYDGRDQLSKITDPGNRVTSFGYDLYDLETVTDPLLRSGRRYTDAQGRVYAVEDPLHRRSEIHYDVNGRVSDAIDPLGATTHYTYDPMGNLLTMTDALNRTTTWTYDARQRPLTRTDALLKTESWFYSPDERSAVHTDRGLRTTSATFDDLGRLAQLTESDGRLTVPEYDLADRMLSLNDSVSGTSTFGYNALDQLTGETGAAGDLAYAYDSHDRLQSRNLLGQDTLTYAYDTKDRLTSLTQGSEVVSFGYDNLDRRTSTTLPNGVVTTASFDDVDRLTALTYSKSGTTLGNLTYGYDAANQLTSRGGTWDLPLLPNATAQPSGVDANHRLTAFYGNTLTYDDNGNLVSDGSNTYIYNARDQLVEMQDEGGVTSATFEYDSFGRRLSKTVQGETTSYRYDGENPIQETTDRGTSVILSGLGMDERYARDDLELRNKRRDYFLVDHLGSTVALTDSTGAITTHYQYEPYGDVQIGNGPPPVAGRIEQGGLGGLAEISSNPYQYTGRENDRSTGMYYYRARYYSPGMKRFTQEDPLGFVDGPNPYGYVAGNPMQFRDPMGLWAWGDPIDQGWVDFFAGAGDTLSFNATSGIRTLAGWDGAVNKCSGSYGGGKLAGVGLSLAFGGVHLGRNALLQTGKTGGLRLGFRRLFSDERSWGSVRDTWSLAAGNGKRWLQANGQSLHHWLFTQSFAPVNAGFNYLPISAGFNSWMNGSTVSRVLVELGFRGAVLGTYSAPATAVLSGCDCNE